MNSLPSDWHCLQKVAVCHKSVCALPAHSHCSRDTSGVVTGRSNPQNMSDLARPCLSCQPPYSPVPRAQVTRAFSRGWGGCKWWHFPSEQGARWDMDLGAPELRSGELAPAVHCMTQGWLKCSSSSMAVSLLRTAQAGRPIFQWGYLERGKTHSSVEKSDKSVSNKVKRRQ